MNILIDTNVFLDVFWKREPFAKNSSEVLKGCELGIHSGFMNVISVANIDYLGTRQSGKRTTLFFLKTVIQFIEITPSTKKIVQNALFSDFKDVADSLQYYSAIEGSGMDAIITRDVGDFKYSLTPVYTPEEFLKLNS